jgi:hypothetical protein
MMSKEEEGAKSILWLQFHARALSGINSSRDLTCLRPQALRREQGGGDVRARKERTQNLAGLVALGSAWWACGGRTDKNF